MKRIINSSERAEAGNNIILDFATVKNINYGIVLKNGMFDMIPRNAFIIDDEAALFAQEWKIENVQRADSVYRSIDYSKIIDNVKNFEFKVLITWVNNHIYELSEGKNNIIKDVGSYRELVDKILKSI